ncbi:MAG TPA: nicotinate-nucleotide--dimethylbenzimidazole phosphoribosyltransferase, partial [Tahibacter sp.]|nr:nicotinate-nucleotide--dimethylbenzimidazole phosphoribosyltransferase [Tahibacter sp.]
MTSAWLDHPARLPDPAARDAALARQAVLTKPAGALGELERLAVTLAALQGRTCPAVTRVHIAVFAADHGIAAAGVSAYPQAVTGEMVRNFATGGAAISVLARELGASLEVVQLGTVNDPGPLPGVRREWIAPATTNFLDAPAMDDAQLVQALAAGRRSAVAAVENGAELFIGGEMGIGNTTAATALACALLGGDPPALTGAGTGLDAAGIRRKAEVIAQALDRHRADLDDAREVLRRLGGFEIAALAGAYVAAAQHGLPVLVDGFIASVAALAAVRLNPACRDWLLFAHRSAETGHARVLVLTHGAVIRWVQCRLAGLPFGAMAETGIANASLHAIAWPAA